jgi:hypothetical protein
MRLLAIAALGFVTFTSSMLIHQPSADALVCARGVWRAGCVGPHGGVVVRRPVVACRWVWVNGVRIHRCV